MNGRPFRCGTSDRRDCAVVVEQVALRDRRSSGQKSLSRLESFSRCPRSSPRPAAPAARPPPTCRRGAPGRTARAGGRRASTRANSTSQTSFGSTQTTSPLRTFGIFGTTANGESSRSSGRSFASSSSISFSVKPVPTFPTHSQLLPAVDAEDERAEAGRAPALALRVAADDELLPAVRLDLQPVAAALALLVARRRLLGHDALEPLLLRRLEQRLAVVEGAGELDDRVPRRAASRAAPGARSAAAR